MLPQLTEFGLAVEKRKRGPTYVDVMSSVYIGLVCEVLALSIVESANYVGSEIEVVGSRHVANSTRLKINLHSLEFTWFPRAD